LELGDPILGNAMMLGALAKVCELPILREDFEAVIMENLPAETVGKNLEAFDWGSDLVRDPV
jgi:indolepyruvate ferredoxin oxidoreductase beta subunit